MFSIFDSGSQFGQMANQAINSGLDQSAFGTLAQYMNNKYGNGSMNTMNGSQLQGPPIPKADDASADLAKLMQTNGQQQGGGSGQGMQMIGSLISALI